MIEMALEFIEEFFRKDGPDEPLPAMTEPWFHYRMEMPTCCPGGRKKPNR